MADAAPAGGQLPWAESAALVPRGLQVVALPGGNGVLELTALTLRRGQGGVELYAALENRGAVPACSAALSVELFDRAEQSVAAGIGGLLTQRFYRRTDGSGTVAACVGPGEVTMAAVGDLPATLVVEEVQTVVYRCPYFALDVEPIAGLMVVDVSTLAGAEGTVYRGTLVNGLRVPVSQPAVTFFAVNTAGRPVGMAVSRGAGGATELLPGGRWSFETAPLSGVSPDQSYLAYPTGALETSAL